MKLRLIAEAASRTLVETSHGMWRQRADETVVKQSAKNLVITALSKIRDMLGEMGLTKNPVQKYRIIEPIGQAVTPFNNLRRAIQKRAKQDAQMLMGGGDHRERIEAFWGIKFPTGYYGVHANVNAEGQFDELIRQTIATAKEQPVEARIELLNRLARASSFRPPWNG